MKIRTQLVLAFLLLATVPLTAIVLYSYMASLRAVRGALEEESRALTEEMDERLDSVRRALSLRFADLADVPFSMLVDPGPDGGVADLDPASVDPILDRLVRAMGDAAPLIQSLEFVPAEPGRAPRVPPPPALEPAPRTPGVPPGPEAPGPPTAPPAPGTVVIDVPRILAEAGGRSRAGADAGVAATPELAGELLDAAAETLAAEQERLVAEIDRAARAGASGPEMERLEDELEARVEARSLVLERLHGAIAAKRRLPEETLRALEERHREQELLLGGEFEVPVMQDGEVVGHVKAAVASRDVLRDVLKASVRSEGEVPFAIDREGTFYTVDEESLEVVESLELTRGPDGRWHAGDDAAEEWVVATSEETATGLTFGIARRVRESLAEVRRTAARNFAYGLGLIVLGAIGIQPLSRRMTRQLEIVTRGAERIARGDLQTRLPVGSRGEFGTLAQAFNHMARDLSGHQERLLREERRRKEKELEETLLRAEFERKSEELEEARRFQLSLLPEALPEHPAFELAVAMITATEVGGDFYDFHLEGAGEEGAPGAGEGVLTVAVGDGTGHGARAGTMVTVIKSLFSAYVGSAGPARFLEEANRAIKRMNLGRMAMALALARLEGRRMTVASAAMPPALVHRRATGGVEEVNLAAMPLGGLDLSYSERQVDLEPGDTVLLLSDGLPELPNERGEPLGYGAVREAFGRAATGAPEDPDSIIAALEAAAHRWAGAHPPADDRTYVVIRVRS